MGSKIKSVYKNIGLPRLIIFLFFILVVIGAYAYGLGLPALMGNVLRRWGMYGILVLAMVPAIQCGIGPNFGISLGIVCGLFGSLVSIELGVGAKVTASLVAGGTAAEAAANSGAWVSFGIAAFIALVLGAVVGVGYGLLLNRVKGSEMTVSTYVGFSIIAFMNIIWVILPFVNGDIIWPYGGKGARTTISLASTFGELLNRTLGFTLFNGEMEIPTGLLLFFFFICALVYIFMHSKTGIAMSAAGANPTFARASGINVDRMRILGTAISTALGALGIVVYAQAFGFLQMYIAPLMMGFHCVAAILIGGASTTRAKISHVIVGTFLFQGILVVALPVANKLFAGTDISDIMRIIVSNGIIIYALTKVKGGATNEE